MKTQYNTHNAFTMIELVIVIVILGIVSSIGSEVIVNVYKNYILQRATHRASLKTELAAQQIANMLSYRIPGTTLARNPNNLSDNRLVTDATDKNDTTHVLLEWIGTDNDGFSTALPPPWNGFCDVAASSQTTIKTPGSKLTNADTILKKLSGSSSSIDPAIFFKRSGSVWKYSYDSSSSTIVEYEALRSDGTGCLGMVSNDTSCISTVSFTDDETFTFTGNAATSTNKVITEHYKLAWTAYAIRPITNSRGLFDLELYYNYQPWNGGNLNGGWPSTHSTIITNVSVFKFAESGNTFRFKICAQENIGEDYNITICKEKAVAL
jgi:prepilin-type N-terminal cleavage/methylation domain-containing protein